MEPLVHGLHHITAMASGARATNRFITRTLGLRRVKKTVNFDAPEVYHLGEALRLPRQHAHLREALEARLEPLA